MRETTYEYKLPVNFSKAKLAWCPFATMYYSNAFTFLQIYPLLLQFTYTVYLKIQTPRKLTQALTAMRAHLKCLQLTLQETIIFLATTSFSILGDMEVHN